MKSILLCLLFSVNFLRADVNTASEMLSKACREGDVKTAQNLLENGVNPDLPDRYGVRPLNNAVSFNQTRAVELLLTYHADPNPQVNSRKPPDNSFPSTPLQHAAYMGNLQIASILAAAGARMNTRASNGRTALQFAVLGIHLDVMRFLIEEGADVNTRDAEGTSPLDDAVWNGDLDAVAILLAHGARLNEAESKTGATPINEAAYRGKDLLVGYLLQFHPDLGIPDKQGFTPLENAMRRGEEDTALLLLAAETKELETPHFFEKMLDGAIRKDESILVEALLKHGASANAVLPSGATPLDVAAFAGSSKVVRLLLENHANPNASGRNGTSPLEDACLKGFEAVAGMLLDHGAQVNQINSGSGTTALYSAASFGKAEVVKVLLERGANPNLCGKKQKAPYQAALENGYRDVAAQIQNHGGAKTCEQ